MKGLRSRYNNKEEPGLPRVRKFVLEYLQNLDRVLTNIERSRATISVKKLMFYQADLKIIGYVCDANGRYPKISKIIKIAD